MLRDHVGCVLDGVARLLVGAGLLQDMSCEYVPDVMRTMRQQAFNGASSGIWVVDAVSLDRERPGFLEGCLIVGRIGRGNLDGLHEERSRIGCLAEKSRPVPADIGIYRLIETAEITSAKANDQCQANTKRSVRIGRRRIRRRSADSHARQRHQPHTPWSCIGPGNLAVATLD